MPQPGNQPEGGGGSDGKDRNIEIYAPKLIQHYLGIATLPPSELTTYLQWWQADVRGNYQRWAQSSCNWDAMLDAVWILHAPNQKFPRGDGTSIDAVQKWTEWFNWQFGLQPPPSSEPGPVRYVGGRETLSNTYEPFRWGSVAAVQWWAQNQGNNPQLAQFARQYSQVSSLLMAASASPTPAVNKQSASGNRLFYDGPYMPQAGMRATEAHTGQDCRGPLFALACNYNLKTSKREEWPAEVARKLGASFRIDPSVATKIRNHVDGTDIDPGYLEKNLKGIQLWAEIHHMRWSNIRSCYTPKQMNSLTPCMFGNVYQDESKTVETLFPWNKGRADRQHPAPGTCSLVEENGTRKLVAVAQYPPPDKPSVVEATLPSDATIYVFLEGPDGCRVQPNLPALSE